MQWTSCSRSRSYCVPLQWKHRGETFFDKIQAASEQSQLSPEQAETLVLEATQAVCKPQSWVRIL